MFTNLKRGVLVCAFVGATPSHVFAFDLDKALTDVFVNETIKSVTTQSGNTNTGSAGAAQTSTTTSANNPAQSEAKLNKKRRMLVQNRLNLLGYSVGAEDGIFGPGTRAGISAWQRDQGYAATGYLTQEQFVLLRSSSTPTQPVQDNEPPVDVAQTTNTNAPASQEQVQALQANLQELGYYDGALDGVPSPETRLAVSSFLVSKGIDPMQSSLSEALELSVAETGGDPIPAAATPPAGPVALDGREIVGLDQFGRLDNERLILATLQVVPDYKLMELLPNLMSSQLLLEFVQYDRQDWQNPTAVNNVAQQIKNLPFPSFDRISFSTRTSAQSVWVEINKLAPRNQQQNKSVVDPLNVPVSSMGARTLNPYNVLEIIPGSGVFLTLDIEELADLTQMTLPPAQVNKIISDRDNNKVGFPMNGTTYVHFDVSDFRFDDSTQSFKMEGTYRGADYRGRIGQDQFETIVYQYPNTDPNAATSQGLGPQKDLINAVLADIRKVRNNVQGPRFLDDGSWDLRTATYGLPWFELFGISALLSQNPDLMDDDNFALDHAPRLLTISERQRAFRGTPVVTQSVYNMQKWARELDTFQRREVAERIRNELGETLENRTFNEPIAVTHVVSVGIGEYDFDRQAFPLEFYQLETAQGRQFLRTYYGLFGNFSFRIPPDVMLPDYIAVPEAEARKFYNRLAQLGAGVKGAQLAISMTLPAFPEFQNYSTDQDIYAPNEQMVIDASVDKISIFVDQDLTEFLIDVPFQITEPETYNGMTAEEIANVPAASIEQIIGTALVYDTQNAEALRQLVLNSTPSYQAVADEQKPTYAEFIIGRYTGLVPDDTEGLWSSADTVLWDLDAPNRAFTLKVSPTLYYGSSEQGIERANIQFDGTVERNMEYYTQSLFVVDDQLLNAQGSGFANYANDGGVAAVLENWVGQQITTAGYDTNYMARMRYIPKIQVVDDGVESGRPVVRFQPEIKEYFLLFNDGQRTRVIFHEVAGQASEDGFDVSKAALPGALPKLAPEALIEVRKSGRQTTDMNGVAVSCAGAEVVPAEYQGKPVLPLPFSEQQAASAYLQFFAEQNTWFTTAKCLDVGIASLREAGNEDQLVFRAIDSEGYAKGSELRLTE